MKKRLTAYLVMHQAVHRYRRAKFDGRKSTGFSG